MTTAVTFAREKNYLPLLFGVPLFIICGFTHCVADAFYYLCVPVSFLKEHAVEVLGVYACIVLGNFAGCNLYRFIAGSSSRIRNRRRQSGFAGFSCAYEFAEDANVICLPSAGCVNVMLRACRHRRETGLLLYML